MKNILLGLVAVVILLVLGVLGAAAMQPETLHVERSATMQAAPADLVPQVSDLDKWAVWNPWKDYDPAMKTTYSDPAAGVGAWYEWTGNDQVGHGKMAVLSVADDKVTHDLEFFEPWQSKALITFTFTPEGDQTKVTWSMDEKPNFSAKVAGLFMDMDAMLGADFEKGLAKLKPIVEAEAKARLEAEAKAKAEAEAAAAAALAPADPNAPAPAATP